MEDLDLYLTSRLGRSPDSAEVTTLGGASRYVMVEPGGAVRIEVPIPRGLTVEGTVVDDVLTYRGADEVHVVINASGREADPKWFREHTAGMDVTIDDVSVNRPSSARVSSEAIRSAPMIVEPE